ncbi:MAG: hypothetical protein EYC62_08460 [Alphaproteobacteria bacterium]|nr:MAG: hypothetical protein EYC62_08460 [Alphaproteobacteria bacterium]
MLQFLRSKASSIVVKALFVVLILSFAIWGIGDIFRGRGSDTTIARVEENNLSPEQLRSMVDRYFQAYKQMTNSGIADNPQIRAAVAQSNIQQWITEKLFIEEATSMGLAVSDEALKRQIAQDRSFEDETTHKFSAQKFRTILQANGWTESQYLAMLRRRAVTSQLGYALADNIYLPEALHKAMFQFDNETRDMALADIPYAKYGQFAKLLGKDKIGQPSDTDLNQFIEANKEDFSTPEYRKLSVLVLNPENIAKDIKISEEELKQAYESHKSEYDLPEFRTLRQALFTSKENADKAYAAITKDKKSLETAAKANNGNTIDLGSMRRQDLPTELQGPAFDAKQGQAAAPVQTKLGWHIVVTEKITPAKTKSFAEVKSELAQKLALEQSSERLYKLSDTLQDEIAGGASFAEISKKIPAEIVTVSSIDREGRDAQGKINNFVTKKNFSKLLTVAFSTDAGKNSGLTEADEGGFYVVHVDEVTPSRLKALTEVREKALKSWQAQDMEKTGQEIYVKLSDQFRNGKTLNDIAKAYGLSTREIKGATRTGSVGDKAAKAIFAVDKSQLARVPSQNGLTIAQLTAVHPTKEKMEGEMALAMQLKKELSQDISDQLQSALRQRFTVHVNEKALETLY